jgi:hypothetical protein
MGTSFENTNKSIRVLFIKSSIVWTTSGRGKAACKVANVQR